jgi:PKD repeat protein
MDRVLHKRKLFAILIQICLFFISNQLLSQTPSAGFIVAQQQGCAPFSVNFTNTSVGASSFQWDFGNGNFSTLPNPQNVYISAGNYSVRLIATSSSGNRDTLLVNNFITVLAGPNISFTSNMLSGCVNQTSFSFVNNSLGSNSYFWDFGDGTISTQTNPSKVFNTPGSYTVSLVGTNSSGCATVFNSPQSITVNSLPSAAFSATPTVTCNPSEVFQFSPNSPSTGSYIWDFGDGTTSTLQAPTKTYSNPGNYSVKLKIINSFGCVDSVVRNQYITIHQPVNPQIIANDSTGCVPHYATFSNTISNATSYSWDFGNGQTSSNGTQAVIFPVSGSYPITLTVTMLNGCSYTTTNNNFINVHPAPVPVFTQNVSSGCAPLTVNFTNQTQGNNTYVWGLGNGNNSVSTNASSTYLLAGAYTVRLTATNSFGCIATQQVNNAVTASAPVALFTSSDTAGCPPHQVNFYNSSIGATSYLWLFGDGTTSTQVNPSKTFQELGTYTVSLISTNAQGCRDTIIMNNLIDVNFEIANYTPPPPVTACSPFTTSFGIQDNSAVSYFWDFGDGTTSTVANPTHTYEEAGVYTVSLIVDNGSVCALNYPNFQTIIIEGGIPRFNVLIDPCPPFPVTFQDTNSVNVVSWLWNFGDGTTSTLETPTHVYDNNNTHHASLTVTTNLGCTYTYIGFNSVNFSSFNAAFNSSVVEGSNPIAINFTSTNQSATSWLWNFGDGTTSTEENPTHIYQNDGEYQVSLQIENNNCTSSEDNGAFESTVPIIVVGDNASGGSTGSVSENLLFPLIGCAPINISFYPQDADEDVVLWNFGDGTTSIEQNPSHNYAESGIYNVTYIIQTPQGYDTIQYPQSIQIGGGLIDFSLQETIYCSYSNIQATFPDSAIVQSLLWNFGNGITSSTVTASHDFPLSASAHNVLLTIIDTLGCQSSRLKSYFSNPHLPDVIYQHAVCKDTVEFTHDFPENYTYLWDFGDSTTSTERFPHHFYDRAGLFEITLQVTDASGCSNTYTLPQQVRVYFPISQIEHIGPISGCAPFTANFMNLSTGAFNSGYNMYYWMWGDGSAVWDDEFYDTLTQVTKIYSTPGIYTVSVRAINNGAGGCQSTDTLNVPITVFGANADFSFTQSGSCLPIQAQFTDLSDDAISWNWDFGDSITSNINNPLLNIVSEPADSITLSIVTSHGCSDTVTKAGIQLFEPEITASYVGNCNPLTVNFSASEDGIASWEWDFGDGITGSGPSPSHTYTTNGNFTARVIVTTLENCRDTVFLQLPIVVTGPTASFNSPTPANCAPSIVEFFDQSLYPVTWLWTFGDGTSSTVQNPTKLYDMPGVYNVQLTVTAENGCSDTVLYVDYVTVLGPGTQFQISDNQLCIGETVQFTDLSMGAVEWEWNFGEGTTSANQHPVFSYEQAGNYVITLFSQDTLGCSAFYTIPLPITVFPFPRAEFTVSDTTNCAPLQVTATNNSIGAISYSWDLGNGQTSTETNPTVSFNQAGEYSIQLIATNEGGCTDTAVFNALEAFVIPTAGFTLSETEGCTPLNVTFNNTSYNIQNPTYSWNFGNQTTSQLVNPTAVYFEPGFYSINLQVQNENGCSDTLMLPSIINVYDTLPAPVTPILRVSVISPTQVAVEWEESVAPDFGSYLIYRKNPTTLQFELIQTITEPHTLSLTDENLNTFENVYCYKIITSDRCGYSIESDSIIEHCTINIEALTREDNQIDITWTPYIGKQPAQYRIYRMEENTSNTEDLGTVSGDVTNYRDSSVFCPVKYRYSVTGEGLNGQWHVESNSDYDLSSPINNLFENQIVNAARSTVVNNESVLTEWPLPDVMGNKVTGYKIYRSTDNLNFIYLGAVPREQRSFLDDNVNVNHTKYFYRIMATNDCGLVGKQGGYSDNVVLKAEATDAFSIELNWTPYNGWGEQGVGFYVVERQRADGSWEIIKQLPGSVTTTVDEN